MSKMIAFSVGPSARRCAATGHALGRMAASTPAPMLRRRAAGAATRAASSSTAVATSSSTASATKGKVARQARRREGEAGALIPSWEGLSRLEKVKQTIAMQDTPTKVAIGAATSVTTTGVVAYGFGLDAIAEVVLDEGGMDEFERRRRMNRKAVEMYQEERPPNMVIPFPGLEAGQGHWRPYTTQPKFALAIENMYDSCVTKGVIGFVAGGVMGFALGFFFATMPSAQDVAVHEVHGADGVMRPAPPKPFRVQAREGIREAVKKSKQMGKTFAWFSILYAGSECMIEKFRGRHDLENAVYGGCATGAVLAAKGGVKAAAASCAGIAAFSGVIEYFMENWTPPPFTQPASRRYAGDKLEQFVGGAGHH